MNLKINYTKRWKITWERWKYNTNLEEITREMELGKIEYREKQYQDVKMDMNAQEMEK
jgi:hypothetical protein